MTLNYLAVLAVRLLALLVFPDTVFFRLIHGHVFVHYIAEQYSHNAVINNLESTLIVQQKVYNKLWLRFVSKNKVYDANLPKKIIGCIVLKWEKRREHQDKVILMSMLLHIPNLNHNSYFFSFILLCSERIARAEAFPFARNEKKLLSHQNARRIVDLGNICKWSSMLYEVKLKHKMKIKVVWCESCNLRW